jgi:L-alanine-DL-glutamate epimerase-like enolase superfamily enzyme
VNHKSVIVVELSDAEGVVGLGEASPVVRYSESPATVLSFFNQLNANSLSFDDPAASMRYLDKLAPGNMPAKCALNVALLDGAAKRQRLSVHDFLKLGFRENRHITSFTIGIDRAEVIREKVLAAARYPVLKVKVGVPDDAANLQALREIALDKWLRLDANEGWKTKEEALENIERLASDRFIQLIEQPMPASTPVKDWAWLKQRSSLPIFADESYHHASDAERCAECFHGVNVKLVKAGGISAAHDALQAARKFGLKTMIGCMIESSILISAAAHLSELCDYLDVDGNLLITNDPYSGVTAENGILSFANATEKFGLRVSAREINSKVS